MSTEPFSGAPRRSRTRRPVPPASAAIAAPPQPVPPSAWLLPDPDDADEDGVVGVGADLAPSTLVDAYRNGIFPWPHPDVSLPWFSPDPRGVLPADRVHVPRSLRQTLRRSGWETTVDVAFGAVIGACADRDRSEGTWITGEMIRCYTRLHDLGWAHSLEVWEADRLVGGLYGVQVGGVFTGESMFHSVNDASKVALVDLVHRFDAAGGTLVDVQLTTDHLRRLGAVDVPRGTFLALLEEVRDDDVRLDLGRRQVARLATVG
ncbi:MAG: leucyl/phenylalanyl-tRNA--protein transferase [Actinobacteria bacterium]|nr:leucyl/phenylalanyl-tRNA--protein transferase [Actinomycetota bacterium]